MKGKSPRLSSQELLEILSMSENATAIYTTDDIIIQTANDAMIQFWGKDRSVIGKPLEEAVPELRGQPYIEILKEVWRTGKTFEAKDAPAELSADGELQTYYFNFKYRAILTTSGNTYCILHTAVNVTENIKSKRRLEKTTDTLKQALDSAGMGTWSNDLVSDILTISKQSRLIHGVTDEKHLTLEESFQMIDPAQREIVAETIREAIRTGEAFEVEYLIHPLDDDKPKWLRSTGKAYYDQSGTPLSISGIILNITEQKQDEMRKNDFIGMVSHELKTPLTSLKGYVQLLNAKAKKENDAFAVNALSRVETQVNKMGSMINGFLNLSRLESGKIHLSKQDFNLEELLAESIEEARLTATEYNITLHEGETIHIHADRDKVGQVISNLLSNAVKYSPRGKSIELFFKTVDNMAVISIKDEGMGIKPQDIDKLFERYSRIESKHTQNISGFGIGLYLCSEIIQRHEGKIWVESEKGKGSTFHFNLPLSLEQ